MSLIHNVKLTVLLLHNNLCLYDKALLARSIFLENKVQYIECCKYITGLLSAYNIWHIMIFQQKHQKEYTDKCNMFTVMYNTWYVLCLVRITQEMPNFLMLSYEHNKSSTYVNLG